VLLLKCTSADRLTDEERPYTLLCAEVVRPVETVESGLVPVGYVTANWWELPQHYTVSGPLGLTRHPRGSGPALTVSQYSVSMVLHGPVFFFLRVYDQNFDPSAFIGGVFAAEGRGGEGCRELHFHHWGSDPNDLKGPYWRVPEPARRLSLQELGLSAALVTCLESAGITTAADLCVRTAEELLKIRNLGTKRLQEVREMLAAAGLWLHNEAPD
jgi:hypothetical protein